LGRYAQFTTGAQVSALHFSWLDKLDHIWLHVRYLATSTFAFPFLPIAFVGLAWRLVTGKRDSWLLVGAIFTVALAILAIYGQKSGYYGFGQSIVRSSFVRYSLPVYALLSVAAGAFFLDTSRVFRAGTIGVMLPIALIGIVVTVGVAQSYDSGVYGFNRLNGLRQDDQAAWNRIEPFLDASRVTPLVIGGPSVEKLIDRKYELYFINYDGILPAPYRLPVIIPVAQQAADERDVYLIASDVNPEDKQLVVTLNALYRPEQVLHAGEFRILRLNLDPANYTLAYVDVWNTYGALDRWVVTPEGYLKTKVDTSYVQLLPPVDADANGRVDQDVTLEFELLDSGPNVATISALDSREGWRPLPLWTSRLEQTGAWRTVTVSLKKGAYLQGRLIVSPGVTLRSIGIVALGPK
jgi:hypothetical protein